MPNRYSVVFDILTWSFVDVNRHTFVCLFFLYLKGVFFMLFIELKRGEETVWYWCTNGRFFRKYENDVKAVRVSWQEYLSAHDELLGV